jgi:hypothetical protein
MIFDNIVSDTHIYIIHFILPLCNCMQAFSTRIGIEVSRVSERLRALIWYGLHIVYCKSRNPTDELYIYSNNFSCLCTVPTRCTLSDSSPGNFQKFDGCFSQKKNKLLCSGFLVNEYSDSEREIRKLKKKETLTWFFEEMRKNKCSRRFNHGQKKIYDFILRSHNFLLCIFCEHFVLTFGSITPMRVV